MVEVKPLSSFTGYPGGKKTKFTAGAVYAVPAAYAEMLVAKGLAEAVPLFLVNEDDE